MRKKGKGGRRRGREPSLFGKLVEVLWHDARRRSAMRLLERQSWGLDFLSMALVNAGRHLDKGLVMTITDRSGVTMELRYDDVKDREEDDSVFMHLDDDAFVERFIAANARR